MTTCVAGWGPECTEQARLEVVEVKAETLTLAERTEDLQPAQEKIEWVMTAMYKYLNSCQVA